MRSREDIESYLMRAGLMYEEVEGKDIWLVQDPSAAERIVVSLTGDLVLFRVKVLELDDVKAEKRGELFERLLELNASDMVHGAYGIADDAVVLTCVLRLPDLDYNEFQGTIDDFSLAFSNHYQTLAGFRDAA